MNNDIKNIFGGEMAISMEGMVGVFKDGNMTTEEITEIMKKFPDTTRAGIHITALLQEDKETADKIYQAIETIRERRIDEFKLAVAKGKENDFLSTMSWTDKSSLEIEMGLFRIGFPGEKPLSNEEQLYWDILEKSIDEDIEKEALSQGFRSVEEWREHNAKVASYQKTRFRRR